MKKNNRKVMTVIHNKVLMTACVMIMFWQCTGRHSDPVSCNELNLINEFIGRKLESQDLAPIYLQDCNGMTITQIDSTDFNYNGKMKAVSEKGDSSEHAFEMKLRRDNGSWLIIDYSANSISEN